MNGTCSKCALPWLAAEVAALQDADALAAVARSSARRASLLALYLWRRAK